ncbi:type II toxin-antitoxin system VapC family toxin [Oceanithermus sp.]
MGTDFLVDTHVLLFSFYEPRRLSPAARKAIENLDHALYVSSASAWEIATKHRIGKLNYPDLNVEELLLEYPAHLARFGAIELAILSTHALYAGSMKPPHKDPFDRIIAAQARLENLTVISADPAFDALGVRRLW